MMVPMFSRERIEARDADIDRRVRQAVLVHEAGLERSPARVAGWFAARAIRPRRGPESALRPLYRVLWRDTSVETSREVPSGGCDTTAA